MKQRHSFWENMAIGLFVVLAIASVCDKAYADSLDVSTKANIVAGSTAAASDVKTAFDNIATWSTNIADDNIKSGAAIAAAKISGTAVTLSGAQTITGDKTITGALQGANPLIFEGATADANELTLAVPDAGGDITYTIQGSTTVSSTIKSWQNAGTADVSVVFEGATADAFETTITATDPTADVTITLPAAQDVNLGEQVVKAWANFDGTGTPAYSDSFNFTGSITDNGTGDWTLTIDTDFANANYAVAGTCVSGTNIVSVTPGTRAVGTIQILCRPDGGGAADSADVSVIIIGDR